LQHYESSFFYQLDVFFSFTDHKALPTLNRIPGLKLSGQAFADTLMVFEFLHNFGETLGFGECCCSIAQQPVCVADCRWCLFLTLCCALLLLSQKNMF
jgi:hypothetical protein